MSADTPGPEQPARPAALRRRADFVAAGKGKRVHMRSLVLQGNAAAPGAAPRVGFTVTKKTGGAVERNRIRRRLKEALRLSAGLAAQPGHDYVVVARREALTGNFSALARELQDAFFRLHNAQKPRVKTATAPPAGEINATKDRARTS